MKRPARPKRSTPRKASAPKEPAAKAGEAGRPRRLLLLLCVGATLVCLAAYVRHRAGSVPQLRIPPVETKDILPAVAREIGQREEAIVANPQSAEAWGMYGLVLLAHDFREQAAVCFEEAERLDNADYRWPYYFGMTLGALDIEKSLHAFERAVERQPNRLTLRLRLAEWLFDMRRTDASQREIQVVLAREPDNPRAQLLLARILFQAGKFTESLDLAQRAAATVQGRRRDVHELLARIHARMGNTALAAEETARAEEMPAGVQVWNDPEMGFGGTMMRDASILNTLATIQHTRGNTEQWVSLLRQVVEREPNNVHAKEKLALALLETQRYEEAAAFIDETLREYPDFSEFEYFRGKVYLAGADPRAALPRFEQAAQLKPDYADAYLGWGQALVLLGRHQEAITPLRQAVRLSPSLADAYDALGRALQAAGQTQEAITNLRHAADLEPADVAIGVHLAEALVAADRRDEARQVLRRIVAVADDPAPAQALLGQLDDASRSEGKPGSTNGTHESKSN